MGPHLNSLHLQFNKKVFKHFSLGSNKSEILGLQIVNNVFQKASSALCNIILCTMRPKLMNKHLIFYSQAISRGISSYTYFNLNRANLVKSLGYQDFQMRRFHRIFGHIVLCGRITLQGDFCMLAKFGWWHCCIVTALLIFFFESVFKAFQEIGKQKILTSSK